MSIFGGAGEIRTHARILTASEFSRLAPSATWVLLHIKPQHVFRLPLTTRAMLVAIELIFALEYSLSTNHCAALRHDENFLINLLFLYLGVIFSYYE